jgi:hypothetical protein
VTTAPPRFMRLKPAPQRARSKAPWLLLAAGVVLALALWKVVDLVTGR